MGNKVKNEGKLLLFCAMVGAVAGIIFWLFLLVLNQGTWLIWDLIPRGLGTFRWYPLIACAVGGLIIGIFRKCCGDYPEDMMTVFGKLKKTGTYPYRKLLAIIIAALLPLIFGSSVGPEAGMVGVIVALCCWAGDNLKFAGKETAYYSRIGAATGLSVMFHSPLFGILDVEEGQEQTVGSSISRSTKIILYCVAAGAGFGCFYLLSLIIRVSEGFPSFEPVTTSAWDYVLFLLYLAAGAGLGLFFEYTEKLFHRIAKKLPSIIGELIAGVLLGGIASFLPVILFSGEEQMGELIRDYAAYAPMAMIGIAFLKVCMTSLCIQLGLKGGHFFPLIFGAVCLGFGISLLFFPGDLSHATFAAAVTAAGTLGVSMKKPLAVSMLLLLCFPVRMLLWILPAAALAAWAGKYLKKNKVAAP